MYILLLWWQVCFLWCSSTNWSDHRLTYISVQLTLISLFLHLDLDYLCAARIAPFHSWRNPVERMMSIVNLGLQSIGLARKEMGPEFERKASKAKSLKDLRQLAEKEPGFKDSAIDSMESVKVKLSQIPLRLKLKDKEFKVFTSATSQELDNFCTALLVLMPLLIFLSRKAKLVSILVSKPLFYTVAANVIFLTYWSVVCLVVMSANQWGWQKLFYSSWVICLILLQVQTDTFWLLMIYLANRLQRNTDHPSKQRKRKSHRLSVLASNMWKT